MHHFGLDTSLKAVLVYPAYYRMYFVVSPKNYDTYTTLYMSKSSFIASEHLERKRERDVFIASWDGNRNSYQCSYAHIKSECFINLSFIWNGSDNTVILNSKFCKNMTC